MSESQCGAKLARLGRKDEGGGAGERNEGALLVKASVMKGKRLKQEGVEPNGRGKEEKTTEAKQGKLDGGPCEMQGLFS